MSKQAKALRKALGFVPSAERSYTTKTVKTVAVDTGKVDANGKAIMTLQARQTTTADGLRKAYQQAKRLIKKGVL